MAARSATIIPKLRRLCSFSSRIQTTSCSLRNRSPPVPDHFIIKKDLEAEKALQTAGEAFVKRQVFEKLNDIGSSKKEVNDDDEPIFFFHTWEPSNGGAIYTAFSLGDDGNVSPKFQVYPPFPLYRFQAECLCICNGIISYSDPRKYALWNPKTDEVKILPQPPSLAKVYPLGVEIFSTTKHIWFDHRSQDCKVILFSYTASDYDPVHRCCVIDLYSLRTDSWKTIPFPESIIGFTPQACINGVYYTYAFKAAKHYLAISTDLILSFDLSTEAFSCLPLPPCPHNSSVDRDYSPQYRFVDYNGLMSVFCSYYTTDKGRYHEHWVMRNGSWDRVFIFQNRNALKPLGFWKNGESLFFISEKKLVVFDSSTGKMKHVDGIDFSHHHHIYQIIPFSESSMRLNHRSSHFEDHQKEEEEEDDGHMIDLSSKSCTSMYDYAGEAFVEQQVFEKLNINGSSKKEVNDDDDEPIFFAHSRKPANCGSILTAFSLGDDGNISPKYDVSPPFPLEYNSECWGICNGIGVYRDSLGYALWNLKTNEVMDIPSPPSLLKRYPPGVKIRRAYNDIWYDDKTQDCKAIEVYYLEFGDLRIRSRCIIDLYSLRTDSWKKFSCPKPVHLRLPYACINGVFYANASKDSSGVIFSFDLSTRAFSCLPQPPHHMNHDDFQLHYIVDYNGMLSVLTCFTSLTDPDALYEHWVMRNGSWHKLSVYRTRNVVMPLGFSKNGESLFFQSKTKGPKNRVVEFDSATQKVKHVAGIDASTHALYPLIPFSESSVEIRRVVGSKFEKPQQEEEDDDLDEYEDMVRTTYGYYGPL